MEIKKHDIGEYNNSTLNCIRRKEGTGINKFIQAYSDFSMFSHFWKFYSFVMVLLKYIRLAVIINYFLNAQRQTK